MMLCWKIITSATSGSVLKTTDAEIAPHGS
jgi:hypothetical protein